MQDPRLVPIAERARHHLKVLAEVMLALANLPPWTDPDIYTSEHTHRLRETVRGQIEGWQATAQCAESEKPMEALLHLITRYADACGNTLVGQNLNDLAGTFAIPQDRIPSVPAHAAANAIIWANIRQILAALTEEAD